MKLMVGTLFLCSLVSLPSFAGPVTEENWNEAAKVFSARPKLTMEALIEILRKGIPRELRCLKQAYDGQLSEEFLKLELSKVVPADDIFRATVIGALFDRHRVHLDFDLYDSQTGDVSSIKGNAIYTDQAILRGTEKNLMIGASRKYFGQSTLSYYCETAKGIEVP